MKLYKKHFIKYLSNIKKLGEGSIYSYCSNISSYLDRTIQQIDPTHNSIFYTIDRELLELYFNELKENPKFNNSKPIHRNSLSALKAYLKFCLYCENTDFEPATEINPTENLTPPHKEVQTDKDASYEKEFRVFARFSLEETTINQYCSAISNHVDPFIREYIDKKHNSIFLSIDATKLDSWKRVLSDIDTYNKENARTHNTISCAFQKYIDFAFYYSQNLNSYSDTASSENITPAATDKNISIEDIEKEIATFAKYNQPIPGELIKAKEDAISFEKKKKQRLLKNNIEYSLNNILSQIPLSMEYNISYTKENGFIIDFI